MAANYQQALTILRRQQVQAHAGVSCSTNYAYGAKGEFPSPVSLGALPVGWIEAEIDAWLATRIENSRKAA